MADTTTQPGLEALPAKPKSAAERSAEVLAAGPDSSDMLQKMQARVDELTSPWHGFQSALDDMVARARNNPEAALRQRAEQKQQEQQDVQSLGMGLANINMMRQQLNSMRGGLQGNVPQQGGQPPQGGQPLQGGQQDPNAPSGYNFKGVPLTIYEYQTLKNYSDQADISGFNAAFKAISDIHSRAEAEAQTSRDNYTPVQGVISGYDKEGKFHNYPGTYTKKEMEDWSTKGIFPAQFQGTLVSKNPPQKKAMGGSVRHMAMGGDPAMAPSAPVDNSLPQDIGQASAPNPANAPVMSGSGMQGSFLDTALSSLMGSAQAAPPAMEHNYNIPWQQKEQESELAKQQQKNQAQLKSTEEERKQAADYVGQLGPLSTRFDAVQRRAQMVIDHAAKHPDEFAYRSQAGSPVSYALDFVNAIPYVGKDLEQAGEGIKEKLSGQETVNRRSLTNGNAQTLGIDYLKEEFGQGTGAKVGATLTQIAQNAKNIGIDKPAMTNLVNAYMIYATAAKQKDAAQAWEEYKRENPNNPDPNTFLSSPKYQAVETKWATFLDNKIGAITRGIPPEGTKDVDKNGNPIVWKDGKPMREKQ